MKIKLKSQFLKRRLEILSKTSAKVSFEILEDELVLRSAAPNHGIEWVSKLSHELKGDYKHMCMLVDVSVFLKRLQSYKATLDDKITLTFGHLTFSVKLQNSIGRYEGQPSQPTVHANDYKSILTFDADNADKTIKYSLGSVGDEFQHNPALDGVCLISTDGQVSAMSTDGQLLTTLDFKEKSNDDFMYVLDAKLWKSLQLVREELSNVGELTVSHSIENPDILKINIDPSGNYVMYGQRIVGKFPVEIIQQLEECYEDTLTIKFEQVDMKNALMRAVAEKPDYFDIDIKGNKLKILTETYSESISITNNADAELELRLSTGNLISTIGRLSDRIYMRVVKDQPMTPCQFESVTLPKGLKSALFYINKLARR
jgi:hypothetical protein